MVSKESKRARAIFFPFLCANTDVLRRASAESQKGANTKVKRDISKVHCVSFFQSLTHHYRYFNKKLVRLCTRMSIEIEYRKAEKKDLFEHSRTRPCVIYPNFSVARETRSGARWKWVTGPRRCSKVPTESGETQLLDSEPATCACNVVRTCVNTGGVRDPTSIAHQGLSLPLPTYSGDHLPRVKAEYCTSVGTDSIMRLVSTKPNH